jgi:hypothetical protein
VVLLCLTVQANASRVAGNSSYGSSSGATDCTDITLSNGTYVCDAGQSQSILTGEAFDASFGGNDVVFDFKVNNPGPALSDFVLTLTDVTAATTPIAQDGVVNMEQVYGYGLFDCANTGGSSPQCGAVPVNATGVVATPDGSSVSFQVNGANPANGYVFFLVLNEPNGGPAEVTASMESTATPEPRYLPVAAFGMVGLIVLYRRRGQFGVPRSGDAARTSACATLDRDRF